MTEGQADDIISLLSDILNKLDSIESNTNSPYTLRDVCSRLDDLDSKLGYIESNTSNL